jgi:3-oxoacyl-[acyl-carrier protein] reductase
MQAQRWGRVVAITSIAVRQPRHDLILSNTARTGATGFLRTLAREVAKDGVTVNSVLPGIHATARMADLYPSMAEAARGVPKGEVGDPGDFGQVVAFLCSQQANHITGVAMQIDGGTYAALL